MAKTSARSPAAPSFVASPPPGRSSAMRTPSDRSPADAPIAAAPSSTSDEVDPVRPFVIHGATDGFEGDGADSSAYPSTPADDIDHIVPSRTSSAPAGVFVQTDAESAPEASDKSSDTIFAGPSSVALACRADATTSTSHNATIADQRDGDAATAVTKFRAPPRLVPLDEIPNEQIEFIKSICQEHKDSDGDFGRPNQQRRRVG